jgi:hypothetical protein
MEKKSPFWSFIEELDDFSAPLIDWKNTLSAKHDINDFRLAFLSSMDEYAKTVRCPAQCDRPCPMRIQHKEKCIEAVCGENISGNQSLDEHDILVYRLNMSKLHRLLSGAFGIELDERSLNSNRRYYLGEYAPYEGISYPVYVSYCNFRSGMSGMIKYLCAENLGKFILLAASRRFLTPETESLLEEHEVLFVSLEDELIIDRQCNISLRRSREEIFAPLLNKNPSPEIEFFPTTPNATWEDIRIHFLDEHTVTIQIGENIFTRNYFQMGMASSLNNGPLDRWHFLRKFAEGCGACGWNGAQPSPANRKQKQLLCENLSEFFRIPGEPIFWDEGRKAYVTRFRIRPDSHSTEWKGKRKGEP